MTQLYGRIRDKNTGEAVKCEVLLEPELLAVEQADGTLLAVRSYLIRLDDEGDFAIEMMPGPYWLCLSDARLRIVVPDQQEVSLKELVAVRYRNT